jgi:hypothetical protein
MPIALASADAVAGWLAAGAAAADEDEDEDEDEAAVPADSEDAAGLLHPATAMAAMAAQSGISFMPARSPLAAVCARHVTVPVPDRDWGVAAEARLSLAAAKGMRQAPLQAAGKVRASRLTVTAGMSVPLLTVWPWSTAAR